MLQSIELNHRANKIWKRINARPTHEVAVILSAVYGCMMLKMTAYDLDRIEGTLESFEDKNKKR